MKYLKYIIVSAFFFQSCSLFQKVLECKEQINAPNAEIKPMLQTLEKRGFNLNLLEFDENGFPYQKGEFVFSLLKDERGNIYSKKDPNKKSVEIQVVITDILSQLKKLEGYGVCFDESDISFDYCECNSYLNMKIESDIVGNPITQSVEQKGASSEFVDDVSPNYINYHSEELGSMLPEPIRSTPRLTNKPIGLIVGLLDTGFQATSVNGDNYDFHIPFVGATAINTCDNGLNEGPFGINFTKIDLESNITQGQFFNKFSADYSDDNYHGSHIASNIISHPNVKVSILPVKIQNSKGVGTLFEAVCGIKFAVRKGASIINASWVFHHKNPADLEMLRTAIEDAGRKGVLFVTSAGNDGAKLGDSVHIYPAMFYDNTVSDNDNVIVVSAIEQNEDYYIPEYANRNSKYVDILAQGKTYNFILGNDLYSAGTSFSTGVVVKALARFHNQGLNSLTLGSLQNATQFKNSFYLNKDWVQKRPQIEESYEGKILLPAHWVYPKPN